MDRRKFLHTTAAGSALGLLGSELFITPVQASNQDPLNKDLPKSKISPRAIAMWDFSWLERRWPGAGYEDWDLALDELKDRGYDALRIDAYPHLLAEDALKEWTLRECWNTQDWGSPDINKVTIQPNLNIFISKCRDRDIKVGLSTWFREDLENTRMKIISSEKHAVIWIKTLQSIAEKGLLDNILYVDLCNEWPGDMWAPFFRNNPPELTWGQWHTKVSMEWMKNAIGEVRKQFPGLLYCFSFDNQDVEKYQEFKPSFMDMAEHHLWMVKSNNGEFYRLSGYDYARFSPIAYKNLAAKAKPLYDSKPEYWNKQLTDQVLKLAKNAAGAGLPLITTECWSLVDYKDWPLLEWNWIKDLCALGALTAAGTGQWIAIATSNFCGPQFVGMWRDKDWHRKLTAQIKNSAINPSLINEKVIHALS